MMLLQLDTIGLMLIGFLCNFFKKYTLDVQKLSGGLQKSYQVCLNIPCVFNGLNFCRISSCNVWDMSSARGLYMEVSPRCDIAFLT